MIVAKVENGIACDEKGNELGAVVRSSAPDSIRQILERDGFNEISPGIYGRNENHVKEQPNPWLAKDLDLLIMLFEYPEVPRDAMSKILTRLKAECREKGLI